MFSLLSSGKIDHLNRQMILDTLLENNRPGPAGGRTATPAGLARELAHVRGATEEENP
jgi:hypothetical protein